MPPVPLDPELLPDIPIPEPIELPDLLVEPEEEAVPAAEPEAAAPAEGEAAAPAP